MKKKLNFFCIVLLILMIVGMVMAGFAGVSDFKRGYEDGINESGTSAYNIIEGLVVFAFLAGDVPEDVEDAGDENENENCHGRK